MLDGFRDCEKCIELETQLRQLCEELSSVQLIVQLLNKDHKQGLTVTTPIQEMETTGEVKENWVMMTAKGDKNRSIGNINPRRKKQINPSVREIEIVNRFEALEVDRHLHRNEVRMEITSEKTICTVNKDQRERMKQNHRATNVKQRLPAL